MTGCEQTSLCVLSDHPNGHHGPVAQLVDIVLLECTVSCFGCRCLLNVLMSGTIYYYINILFSLEILQLLVAYSTINKGIA